MNLNDIIRGKEPKPPRIFLYGVEGIGKSTFAASAPSPVFIQTEDGLGGIDVPHFPLASSLQDVVNAIRCLAQGGHDFRTVVIDSADWLESLIWREVNKNDPKDLAYGRGHVIAADQMRGILNGLNTLRDLGMIVILTGHAEIKTFQSPEADPYDRYQPKLQARASALIREWADCVLFANYHLSVQTAGSGFKTYTKAISSGTRYLYTSERPAYLAKNRYSLPDRIELNWDAFFNELIKQKP